MSLEAVLDYEDNELFSQSINIPRYLMTSCIVPWQRDCGKESREEPVGSALGYAASKRRASQQRKISIAVFASKFKTLCRFSVCESVGESLGDKCRRPAPSAGVILLLAADLEKIISKRSSVITNNK